MDINEYLKKHHLRPANLARGVGAVHCVARRWCRGEVFPNTEYM